MRFTIMTAELAKKIRDYDVFLEAHPTKVGSDYDQPRMELSMLILGWEQGLVRDLAKFVASMAEETGDDLYIQFLKGNCPTLKIETEKE